MLGKKPNKVYDPFLKAGLGYTNLKRLKKAIAAQPKMYDGDLIYSNKLLNALYDTFVPQQQPSAEQTYFSIPSTSDNGSTSKDVPSESPAKSKGLGATSIVENSIFSVAKTPTATNKVIQLMLWIVDSGCSKRMTGNLQLLRNFIEKFIGTLRFRNDHFAAITGYGDYVQGNLTICHVYYVEGLGDNLFSVGQFCDGDLEVSFRSNTCYVQNLEGNDLLTGSRDSNLYTISISEMANSSLVYFLRTKDEAPDMISDFVNQVQRNLKASILMIQTNNGTEFKNKKLRRNRTLVEAARIMLIFSKAPEFLWAEAIATACFTQNRSFVHSRYNKTTYKLIQGRKPNVQYFHVFRSLCYPTNDGDDLGKMKQKDEIGIFVSYSESSCGFHIYNRRTKKIMEMIHVRFDELTAMASECNNLEPGMNCTNFNDSLEDS
ncbi:integrase, catalytic region, zinc finger, CCHC-type containing protein [Tanacetum coccineum]